MICSTFSYVLEFRISFVWKNLVHKDKNQSQESFVWFFRFCCLSLWLSVVKNCVIKVMGTVASLFLMTWRHLLLS